MQVFKEDLCPLFHSAKWGTKAYRQTVLQEYQKAIS